MSLSTPAPSKHAKSTSARDLRYGRRGGRWLPLQTDHEQAQAFAAAIEAGAIVRAKCGCTWWWLVRLHVGQACKACGQPMGERYDRNWVVLDLDPMQPERTPCPPSCPQCFGSSIEATGQWEYFGHAIGACETCREMCRSTDPEGRRRHPNCDRPATGERAAS